MLHKDTFRYKNLIIIKSLIECIIEYLKNDINDKDKIELYVYDLKHIFFLISASETEINQLKNIKQVYLADIYNKQWLKIK